MITAPAEITVHGREHPEATVEVLDDDGVDVTLGEVLVQFRADTLDPATRRWVAITRVGGERIDRRVVAGAGSVRGVLDVARVHAGLDPLPAVPPQPSQLRGLSNEDAAQDTKTTTTTRRSR